MFSAGGSIVQILRVRRDAADDLAAALLEVVLDPKCQEPLRGIAAELDGDRAGGPRFPALKGRAGGAATGTEAGGGPGMAGRGRGRGGAVGVGGGDVRLGSRGRAVGVTDRPPRAEGIARALEEVLRRRDPVLVWTVTPYQPDTILDPRPLPLPARTGNVDRLEGGSDNPPPLLDREGRPQVAGDVEHPDIPRRIRRRQPGPGSV